MSLSNPINPLTQLFNNKAKVNKDKQILENYIKKLKRLQDDEKELPSEDVNLIKFEEYKEPEMTLEESEPYLKTYQKYRDDFEDSVIKLEPILSKKSFRYTVLPIIYHDIYDNYEKQQELHWTVNEIDLETDVEHWANKLSKNDRTFLMHVLAFFASADGIVNANIRENIIEHLTIKEAECAYGKQFDMENTHAVMYSLMIETFIKNPKLKNNLINSIKTMPEMRKKAEWCEKWIKSDKPIAHKMFAFAIVEGIFFSGSFASIFWLKTRDDNLMPGLRNSNTFIARDECQHVILTQLIFSHFKNRLKQSVVEQMIREAVEIEDEFINSALKCRLIGMNSKLMSQYIKYVSDDLLLQFGYKKIFNATNPFEFMIRIGQYLKDNFFEKRGLTYAHANIGKKKTFSTTADF